MKKQLVLRERVYRFYNANKEEGKMFTINHFSAENEHPRTIRRIIDRIESRIPMIHQRKYAQSTLKMNKAKLSKLEELFDHSKGISQRGAASKFKISPSFVNKLLKTKTEIKCYHKMKIPKRTEVQKAQGRSKCATLFSKFRKFENFQIVMDDESYFTLSRSSINGNGYFYSSDKTETPAKVKYSPKSKFEKKVLVWIAASAKGLSKPYIQQSGMAIDQKSTKMSAFDLDYFLSSVLIILKTTINFGPTWQALIMRRA